MSNETSGRPAASPTPQTPERVREFLDGLTTSRPRS